MKRRKILEDDDDEMDVDQPQKVAAPNRPAAASAQLSTSVVAPAGNNVNDVDVLDDLEASEDYVEDEDVEQEWDSDEYDSDEKDDAATKLNQKAAVKKQPPKTSSSKKKKPEEEKPTLPWRNPDFSWQKAMGAKTKMIHWPKLAKMIKEEKLHEQPPNVATYVSINAPPSIYPPKKYCDITGHPAKYTDPATGLRYRDAEVYKIIKTLTPDEVQAYLARRRASTAINAL